MNVYLDTSTILRVLFGQKPILREWASWDRAYTSELMGVEARRTIDRLRLERALDDDGVAEAHERLAAMEGTFAMVGLTRVVLGRAALPMATSVKTLDALHLATALLLRESGIDDLAFATHDGQQATAARAFGFACLGVPS